MSKSHEEYLIYMRKHNKKYRDAHKEELAIKSREYRQKNREKLRIYRSDYRKKLKGLKSNSESKQFLNKLIEERQQFIKNQNNMK